MQQKVFRLETHVDQYHVFGAVVRDYIRSFQRRRDPLSVPSAAGPEQEGN